jgi:hypothetical protein
MKVIWRCDAAIAPLATLTRQLIGEVITPKQSPTLDVRWKGGAIALQPPKQLIILGMSPNPEPVNMIFLH